ncbi:MAG: hypothetical protein U5R31_06770 [Acidimicrobiia bacterium]|nr:hypothetical protein [Acidimicrobiia bacterium]
MTRSGSSGGRTTPPGTNKGARPGRTRHQRRQVWFAVIGGIAIVALVLGTVAASFLSGETTEVVENENDTTDTSPTTAAPAVHGDRAGSGESITGETPMSGGRRLGSPGDQLQPTADVHRPGPHLPGRGARPAKGRSPSC